MTPALLAILEQLPTHPTSGDLLGALLRAEQAGYRRACAEIRAGGPFDDDKYSCLLDEARAERRELARTDEPEVIDPY